MLTLTSVTAAYGESTVLRNISLTVAEGEVVALLGPNGAGKTTLLRTASGLVPARSGTIGLAGEDLTRTPRTPSPGAVSATCRKAEASSRRSPSGKTS